MGEFFGTPGISKMIVFEFKQKQLDSKVQKRYFFDRLFDFNGPILSTLSRDTMMVAWASGMRVKQVVYRWMLKWYGNH